MFRRVVITSMLLLSFSEIEAQSLAWENFSLGDLGADPSTGITNANLIQGLALCKANEVMVHNVPMVAPQDHDTCEVLINEAVARKAQADLVKSQPNRSDTIKSLADKVKP